MKKQDIVICSPQYGLKPNSDAGGEVYDEKILKGLADKGVKVEIILPYGKEYDQNQKNWFVHHIKIPFIHYSYLFNLAIILQLISIYKKTHFKILRIHSPYYVGIGAWIFKNVFAKEVKLVTTYFHFEDKIVFNLIDRMFINKWDHIITSSQTTAQQIKTDYKIKKEKISIIYPGIDQPEPIAVKRQNEISFCGKLIKRKNVNFLIELMRELKNDGIKLNIIGNGPLKNKLGYKIKKLGLENNIFILSNLKNKEKDQAIRQSKIFVFPSLMEGFGLAPLEAMALGVPVVASDRGALPETVGEGGIVIPLDKNLWAREIKNIIRNPQLAKKLSEQGKNWVKKFTWEEAISKIIELTKRNEN
ncbi:MAG: glycosyltransferase family 4 protein [Candidatus Paceibacterota bacterium]|jgi:glycosyltransferase involved in cell wall biosynthesis